jgi:hypothetical protein
MYGYIYLIKDHYTNKVYIGKCKGNHLNTLLYYGSGLLIKRIINKRGLKHLEKIILGYCKTKQELNEAEKYCIEFYRARDKKYGYNIAEGGLGGAYLDTHPNKDVICKKISNSHKGKKSYIRINKKEIINVCIECGKEFVFNKERKFCSLNCWYSFSNKNGNPFKGKHHKKDSMKNIISSNKKRIKIYVIESPNKEKFEIIGYIKYKVFCKENKLPYRIFHKLEVIDNWICKKYLYTEYFDGSKISNNTES